MTEKEKKGSHPLVELARTTIENFILHGDKPAPTDNPETSYKAATFVSLKKSGQLRGCIGTLLPSRDSVEGEVIENSISAATRDPRFPAVTAEELDSLVISVDVLSEPEPVNNSDELDPVKFGIIVRSRGRTGVLLPDLPGIDTVEKQVDIARRKAGIGQDDDVELFRFSVQRYE